MITHTLTETPAWKEAADNSSRPRFPMCKPWLLPDTRIRACGAASAPLC